jgi:hypothetical protein
MHACMHTYMYLIAYVFIYLLKLCIDFIHYVSIYLFVIFLCMHLSVYLFIRVLFYDAICTSINRASKVGITVEF